MADIKNSKIGKFIIKNSKRIITAIILPIVVLVLIIPTIFWGVTKETFKSAGEVFTDILDNIEIDGNNLKIEDEYYEEAQRKLKARGIEENSLGLERS